MSINITVKQIYAESMKNLYKDAINIYALQSTASVLSFLCNKSLFLRDHLPVCQ